MKKIKTCLLLAVLLLGSCGGSDTATTDSKADPFKSFLQTQRQSDGSKPSASNSANSPTPTTPVPDPFRAYLDAHKKQSN